MRRNSAYVYEKFWLSLCAICKSSEPIQNKIMNAYCHNLIKIQDSDCSKEISEFINKLHEFFSSYEEENCGEGSAAASARHMSEEDAEALMDEFLSMLDIVIRSDELGNK